MSNRQVFIIVAVFCVAGIVFMAWFVPLIIETKRTVHMYIHLPQNYVLYQVEASGTQFGARIENKDEQFHVDPDNGLRRMVGPNIGGYHVYSKIITGQIVPHRNDDIYGQPPEPRIGYFSDRRLGYFIIDLHTKKVLGGLNKRDWRKKLRTYGITTEPVLFKPSWRDADLGRNKPQAYDAQ